MRSKEDILKDRYVLIRNGVEYAFHKDTPKDCADVLIDCHKSRTRIVLDYGDEKGSWGEVYGIAGYVGMSVGYYDIRYPILCYNSRSIGGGGILTDCILSIHKSKGKDLLWSR